MSLTPPLTTVTDLPQALARDGHGVLAPADVQRLSDAAPDDLAGLLPFWNELPADTYLRDGGRYRRRRHSCFIVDGEQVQQVPHRSHWQPVEYNALHGGIERRFEPIDVGVTAHPIWARLLQRLGAVCSVAKGEQPWYVEAHQFRIDTTDGIGRPTPEGAHRDGVDFVVVVMVDRQGVKGGETRVFDADGPNGIRFTMLEPWTLLMLDDERVIHETTPIQPLAPDGHRDTLVLTYRRQRFQGPPAD